ncbi:MAG: hypothetical protein JWO77_3451 [Ilumatobacteraceae bacterium]|nr:hypothetical protein [Ilumatobacteraceae bacterium]
MRDDYQDIYDSDPWIKLCELARRWNDSPGLLESRDRIIDAGFPERAAKAYEASLGNLSGYTDDDGNKLRPEYMFNPNE